MELVEKIADLPRWAKWLGMTGIAVMIATADYFLFFTPKYEEIRLLKNNAANLESQVRIIRKASKDYEKLVERIKVLKETLKELENSFPEENTGLLSFLTTINTDLVEIKTVKEGKVEDKPYYTEKEYEVTAEGNYGKAIEWLKETLKKSKALSIKNLDFQKEDDGNVKVNVTFSYVSVKREAQ